MIPRSNRRPKPKRLTVKLWLKKSFNQRKRVIYPLLSYYALIFWKSYGYWKRVKDGSRDLPCAYLNDFPFSRSRMNTPLMIFWPPYLTAAAPVKHIWRRVVMNNQFQYDINKTVIFICHCSWKASGAAVLTDLVKVIKWRDGNTKHHHDLIMRYKTSLPKMSLLQNGIVSETV